MDDSRPSVPGIVRCLQCNQDFRSPDKCRIRRCARCKTRDGDYGRLADARRIYTEVDSS